MLWICLLLILATSMKVDYTLFVKISHYLVVDFRVILFKNLDRQTLLVPLFYFAFGFLKDWQITLPVDKLLERGFYSLAILGHVLLIFKESYQIPNNSRSACFM